MLLVKFEKNWADEFDTFGLASFNSAKEYNEFLEHWKSRFKPATEDDLKEYFEVTTPEELERRYSEVQEEFNLQSKEEVLSWLSAELGKDEVEFYFGSNQWHIFNSWDEFLSCLTVITEDENIIINLMGYNETVGIFPYLY